MKQRIGEHGNFFIKGRCILVSGPRQTIIQNRPYRVFPLNTHGSDVLKAINRGASLDDLCLGLGVRTDGGKQNLSAFLRSALSAGILTQDRSEAGELKVKKQQTSPMLERLFIEVTSRCNLHCAHCYMSATSQPATDEELTYDEILALITRADELGAYRVDLTGGELFLRKEVYQIIEAACRASMLVNVFTNGTLLRKENCEFLADLSNVRTAFVSLDDVDESVHDAFRGQNGAFRRTIESIRLLRESGIRVVINITITKANAGRVMDIVDFCRQDMGVECRVAPIVYVGRGKCFAEDDASPDDIVAAMKRVIGSRQQLSLGYCGEAAWEERNVPGCGVGHRMLYIRADGEICLCPTLSSRESPDFHLGNTRTHDIGELWHTSAFLKRFRESRCRRQDCPHLPVCRGGCRSRAFLQSGSTDSEDLLTCAYFGIADGDVRHEV